MKRNLSLDILRIVMAFMVVGIHARFLQDIAPITGHLLIRTLFNVAVPVFLIINGFYFYPLLKSGKAKKWFKRVVYLYIFWMLVYSIYWFPFSDISFIRLIKAVKTMLFGYAQLWYIPAMFGAALMVTFLKDLPSKKLLVYIALLYGIGVIIQYMGNYHLTSGMTDTILNYYWFHRNFLFIGFAFFGIGFLIRKHDIHQSISTANIISLLSMGVVVLALELYFNYDLYIHDTDFANQLFLLFLCPALFLLVIRLDFKTENRALASVAAAVYFIHMMILYLLKEHTTLHETALTVTVFMLSLFASIFIIALNKRLKFVL